jgi:hypothetical protein
VARIMAGVAVGAGGWLLGHPFEASDSVSVGGRMMGCAKFGRSGSIRTRDLAADGGHDLRDLAADRSSAALSCRRLRWWSQGADMVVPQRVEHVLDLLASGGDHTDVAAATGTDSVAD